MALEELRAWEESVTPIANAHAVPTPLVLSVIWVESRARADAFRYEPKFWLRYMAKQDQYKVWSSQPRRASSSYGLMQIMYAVAVEHGYTEVPEGLFLPRTNLHYGCMHLRKLLDWSAGHPGVDGATILKAALAAYNGGQGGNVPGRPLRPENEAYADRVLAVYRQLTDPSSLTS